MKDILAAMKAHAEAAKNAPKRVRPLLTQGTFSAVSLKSWMEYALVANVPAVGAELVAEINVEEVLQFEYPEISQQAMAALEEINSSLDENHMLRWESCAPSGVKFAMASAQSMRDVPLYDRALHPGDPRAFEILYQFPKEKVGIFKRPIVDPLLVDGYPVEFRVYINNSEVVAVSNYYPQMSLPETYANIDHAKLAIAYAKRILDAVKASGFHVFYEGNEPNDRIDASLDFMLLDNGRLVFLEGGPGYGFGAHPCCFYDPNANEVSPLEGILFSVGEQALPLNVAKHKPAI